MKFTPPENRPKSRESLGSILAFAFVMFWLFGMIVAALIWTCHSDRFEGRAKLGFCNAALISSVAFRLTPVGRARGSMMNLERGIALSQLGRDEQARAAFERALQYSRATPQNWERKLIERMSTLEDTGAVGLWESVVSTTK